MSNRMQENNAIFASMDAIIENNDLWMLSENADVLLHFDFTRLKLLDYHILPCKKLILNAHMRLRKSGNIIYIAPYMENSLVYFDYVSGEMGDINIPYEDSEIGVKNKFNIIVVWKSHLILVGHAVRGVFYYDVISGSFKKYVGYLDELKKEGCDASSPLFSDCYYQKENKLYIPIFCKNMILEIDLDTCINTIYKLQYEKEIKLRTIDGYDQDGTEKFLLTTVNDEMLIWSPVNGVEKMKALGLLRGEEKIYVRAFRMEEKNYYIAAYERKVFVEVDDRIQELEFEYESRGGYEEAVGRTQFEAVFKKGADIYFQARSNGQLFRIDTATDVVHRVDFDVTSEKRKEIADKVYSSRPIIDMLTEGAWFGLDSFLKSYVCREERG